MATTTQAVNALVQHVLAIVQPIQGTGMMNIVADSDWPSQAGLDKAIQKQVSLITVFDRVMSKKATKWLPRTQRSDLGALGIAATCSSDVVFPGQTATVTLAYADGSSAVNVNDAIAICIATEKEIQGPATASATTGETLTSLAAKLAASVNNTAAANLIHQWVSATASGAVVTITNNTSRTVKLLGSCGQVASQYRDVHRTRRHMQIVLWTADRPSRDTISDQLEPALALDESQYGITLDSGEWIQICCEDDFFDSNDAKTGLYRRDFFVALEYSVTPVELAYQVLVPIPVFS